jgi:pimeloyl-ACP methyl ester carboxylesterase
MVLIAAHIYVESKMEEGLKLIETSAKVPPFRDVLAREHGERAAHLVESWLNCWYEHGERTLNLQEYLPEIHCPTLVIQGALDEHATPQHARDIAAGIPNAQLWIIPEVRHMPIHEVTDQLNQVLVDFLKNQKLVFSHSHEKERDV